MAGRFTAQRLAVRELPVVDEPVPLSPDEDNLRPETAPVSPQPNNNPLLSHKLLDAKVRLHRKLIEEINECLQ